MKIRSILSLTAAAVLTLGATSALASSAGQSAVSPEPAPQTAESEIRRGGTLIVALPQSIGSLDNIKATINHENNVILQVCEPLLSYDKDLQEFLPLLASEYSASEDGMTYYFTIRDDVFFSNGRKMTVEDVKYSFDRANTCTVADCIGRGYYELTEILDDTHIAVHLSQPCGAFLNYMAAAGTVIVPKEEIEKAGDDWGIRTLVGTGPFLLDEFVMDEHVYLSRNPGYHGAPSNVDKVEILFMTDTTQMVNAVRTGEVHIGVDIQGDAIGQAEQAGVLVQTEAAAVNLLRFNLQSGPTADLRVRRALMMAVDIEEMDEGIYQYNEATPTYQPINSTSWAYDPALNELAPKYDPDGARELLKEAGYDNNLTLNLYISSSTNRNKMAQVLQSYYEEVGVKLNIIASTTPEWVASITDCYKKDTVNLYAGTWNGGVDPQRYLERFFHSRYAGDSSNAGGYANPDMDVLLDEAYATADQSLRREIYLKVMEQVMQDCTGCYYASENRCWAISPKVHDAALRADNRLLLNTSYNNVWVEE